MARNTKSPISIVNFYPFDGRAGNTDASAILTYMDDVRNYRKRFIQYLTDHDLFYSISYVTPCREEEFMPNDEWDAFEERMMKLQKEDLSAFEEIVLDTEKEYADDNYLFIDVKEVPQFNIRELSGWQRVEKGAQAFILLFVLFIGSLLGAIYLFGKYDLR